MAGEEKGEVGAEEPGVSRAETPTDLLRQTTGVGDLGGSPCHLGLGDAVAQLEQKLAALNLPRLASEKFAEAVQSLGDQYGQSSTEREGRLREVMENIDAVVDEVVAQITRSVGFSSYSGVQSTANNFNRRRAEEDMAEFCARHGVFTNSMIDVPATC